jgi:hypothetical protein
MDDEANRYAQELIEAISAAVARDPDVQACRARVREAGFEVKVSLEALAGPLDPPGRPIRSRASLVPQSRRLLPAARSMEITAADKRFLRSLRIAADEAPERVE